MRRPRNTGGISRRGRIFWIKYNKTPGHPVVESSGSAIKGIALALLRKRLAEVHTGEYIPPDVRRTTLKQLFDALIVEYKSSGRKTCDWLEARWTNRLEPFFGNTAAANVSTDQLRDYVLDCHKNGLAAATINRDLSAIHRAFVLFVFDER